MVVLPVPYDESMFELPAAMRPDTLQQMAGEPLDVLVIGGGITGAGVALDAALRGLRVGLVERDDFACGTSSRSSKMIHGGLRYLATGDVRLVREALKERRGIQQRAAHLVRPLPMLLPVHGVRVPWNRVKLGAGLWIYDLLGAWRAGVRHKWLTQEETLAVAPNAAPEGLLGALSYNDAQADDVRLVLAVLRTAARHGALLCNGANAAELLRDGERVAGARILSDATPGGSVEIEARVVVNATGVWADQLGADAHGTDSFEILPSKGIHLTVPRERLGVDTGMAFFSQTGNSNVFVEPWQDDLAFIGTSDDPYTGDLATPHATPAEIERLLAGVNPFLREPLASSDVIASWAGLRPLVVKPGERAKSSKDVSRNHRTVVAPGLVTLVGGKLTTYRAMAEDAVNEVARQLDRPLPECRTETAPLEGSADVRSSAAVDGLVAQLKIPRGAARHLLRRYGTRCEIIVELCRADPELAEPLHPERPYIVAEVAYAARYELARDVEDVLSRRTRLALETADGGAAATAAVEAVLPRYAAPISS